MLDAQHRDIRARVRAHQFRANAGVVLQDHIDFISAINHVVIRDHDAFLRINDEAGPKRLRAALALLRAFTLPLARRAVAVEEIAEEFLKRAARGQLRHFRRIRAPRARRDILGGGNIHHRRQQFPRERREAFRRALLRLGWGDQRQGGKRRQGHGTGKGKMGNTQGSSPRGILRSA